MESNESLLGKHIGNYLLTKGLSEGSFGSVYLAHHMYFKKRLVALKLLHLHLVAKERESFIREAELLETLRHRYILPIIDIGFDDGRPYLVTDYASGGSLRQRLNQTTPRLFDQDQALTILAQIGEALHYAHQQHVVHRDLKPENILFNAQDEALLADFGLATVLSSMSVKLTTAMGTPAYMAPEQFKGEISQEGDQYALGCIAYELFTGQRLFSAPDFYAWAYKHMSELPIPLRQVNPHIPLAVEQAILKALAKDRKACHADVSTFLAALSPTQELMVSTNREVLPMRTRGEMSDDVLARKVADELMWRSCMGIGPQRDLQWGNTCAEWGQAS